MNIATARTMAAEACPERVAIVDPDRSWTYGELLARASALPARLPAEVHSLSSIGLTGSHAAACLFGAAIAGRSFAPLNHRLPVDQLLGLADRLEEDGYLFIDGRADDVVIRRGENIAPAEVEDALLRHTAVEQAVVVGIPDIEWGERLAASVVLRNGAQPVTPDDLRAHTRALLGSLKCPDVIDLVSSVPLTASGKVLRREVRRALIEDEPGRS